MIANLNKNIDISLPSVRSVKKSEQNHTQNKDNSIDNEEQADHLHIDETHNKNKQKHNTTISNPANKDQFHLAVDPKQSIKTDQKSKKSKHSNNTNLKRIHQLYTDCPLNNAVYHSNHNKISLPRHSVNVVSLPSKGKMNAEVEIKQFAKGVHVKKEELYQQNIHLKTMINDLKSQLNKQKVQTQLQRKKNKAFTQKLTREFKKDIYYYKAVSNEIGKLNESKSDQDNQAIEELSKLYKNSKAENSNHVQESSGKLPVNSNSSPYRLKSLTQYGLNEGKSHHSGFYLVAGIKQKYQDLREEHEKVLEELSSLKQNNALKKLEQMSVYCLVLEESNRKLSTGLQVCQGKLQAYENDKQRSRDENTYNQFSVMELKEKVESLKGKNLILKLENRKIKQENKDSSKTISYLQNLIIEKSNSQHKSTKMSQKWQKQVTELQKQLQAQKEQNLQTKRNLQNKLSQMSSSFNMTLQNKNSLFDEALMQRNQTIKKLQKQINYLSTIITYWKPNNSNEISLEECSSSRAKNSHKKNDAQNFVDKLTERNQFQKQYEMKLSQIIANQNQEPEIIRVSTRRTQKSFIQDYRVSQEKQSFQRKTSATKNSPSSKKMRKLTLEQLGNLPQLLRFRLIGNGTSVETACKVFDYKVLENQEKQATMGQERKRMYISMGQIQSILEQQPFMLKSEESLMLSRYIVEDECLYEDGNVTNGYVYCDSNNEMDRTITKSIMKAFIQTVSSNLLSSNGEMFLSLRKQWDDKIETAKHRLQTALGSIAPQGVISKDKWIDLLKGINIDVDDNVIEWSIGKMLIDSEDLSKLKYSILLGIPQEKVIKI